MVSYYSGKGIDVGSVATVKVAVSVSAVVAAAVVFDVCQVAVIASDLNLTDDYVASAGVSYHHAAWLFPLAANPNIAQMRLDTLSCCTRVLTR